MEANSEEFVKGLFGVKYHYLNNKTRLRYGFTFRLYGKACTLQRKKLFWKEVAWTYLGFNSIDLKTIIEYLMWKEKEINKKQRL